MTIALTIIYTLGCLISCTMCDMIIECMKDSTASPALNDEGYMSSSAILFSLGSWLSVWYLWKNNQKEIKYTWKKWRTRK